MTEADDAWILVLDDDPIVTRSLEALLRAETEWNIAAFNRPSSALSALEETKFQTVVSDFLMPEIDGIHFLKRVKEAQPAASRILLTGYADKKNAIRSINEVGLYQYLEKPWDNDDLLMVLRNAVERALLVQELDDKMRSLSDRDRSLEQLRARLLKAIL